MSFSLFFYVSIRKLITHPWISNR